MPYNQFTGRSKYRAKPTVVDGVTFASKKEANRYIELKRLQETNLIKELKLQPRYELQAGFTHNGKKVRAINYVADFRYTCCHTGNLVVEDVKGMQTEVFKLKRKIFLFKYPEIEFRIT